MSKKRTMKRTWSMRSGAPYPKKDRPGIVREMKRLSVKHGKGFSAAVLLQEAKKRNSPLRKHYNWDDASAAENHRLWQAREMMGCIMVTVQYTTPTGKVSAQQTTRALISDTKRGQRTPGNYIGVQVVMTDGVLQANYLERALAELNAVRMRYSELVELAGVYREIDKLAKKVAAA